VNPDQGGITYVVVGMGGANLKNYAMAQPAWSAARVNTVYGFLDVVVDRGTLTAELRGTQGNVADRFTLTKAWTAPTPGEVSLTVESPQGTVPHTSRLTAATNLPDAQVTWDFGDGSAPAVGTSVQHTWVSTGTFTVKARVQGNDGRTAEKVATVAAYAQDTPPGPGVPPPPAVTPDEPSVIPGTTDGQAQGGCHAAPGLALGPAVLLALAALRRRRR
jgi:uncharacterized protein (TIGR03382 family)